MSAPRITVLQLDTHFPRIPGDVACPETYVRPPQILRVPKAVVARVVTGDPSEVPLAPFLDTLAKADGDLVVTSCGFLAPFQARLSAATEKPVVASALRALDHLSILTPSDIALLTFDADALGPAHSPAHGAYLAQARGLPQSSHLHRVIRLDRPHLDRARAEADVVALVPDSPRVILLECTNLPPYKPALRRRHGGPIHDILTEIERTCPGAVQSRFL